MGFGMGFGIWNGIWDGIWDLEWDLGLGWEWNLGFGMGWDGMGWDSKWAASIGRWFPLKQTMWMKLCQLHSTPAVHQLPSATSELEAIH